MKKYLTKRILLTLLAVCIFFGLIALLFGQFMFIEKDIFTNGKVLFQSISLSGSYSMAADEAETELVKKWLTTLEITDEELVFDVFVNSDFIELAGDRSSVIFLIYPDEVRIFPSFWTAQEYYITRSLTAVSSDPELTAQVEKICSHAVERAQLLESERSGIITN